jgi:hypothetical protein
MHSRAPHHERRPTGRVAGASLLLLAAVALVVLGAGPAPADTGAGTGVGTSSNTDGGHTVTGSGTFALTGGNTLTVAFECKAAATAGAVSTSVHPPAHQGCYLVRNGSVVAYANGITLPGPVALTASTAAIPLLNTTSLQVCWNTYASFLDGYLVQTGACTTISVIDSIPDFSTSTSENKDPYGYMWAVGTQGQDEDYRFVCVSVGGNTHNCLVGATTTGASDLNGASVSVTGPSNSDCMLTGDGVCMVGGVAASGTGPAGTSKCSNEALSVSATNTACGTAAISGTGSANGTVAGLSGKDELCTNARLMC